MTSSFSSEVYSSGATVLAQEMEVVRTAIRQSPGDYDTLMRIAEGIRESYEPFSTLIGKMRPDIMAGTWKTIFADYNTASLPVRALDTVMRLVATDKLRNPPRIIPIYGSIAALDADVKRQLDKVSPAPEGKSLWFTELIARGISFSRFASAAGGLGIDFDAAALYTHHPGDVYTDAIAQSSSGVPGLFVGQVGSIVTPYDGETLQDVLDTKGYCHPNGDVGLTPKYVLKAPRRIAEMTLDALGRALYAEHFDEHSQHSRV